MSTVNSNEKRKISEEYQKLICQDLGLIDRECPIMKPFQYQSKFPYHEGILFHILDIKEFHISGNKISLENGITLDRIRLHFNLLKIFLKKIVKQLIWYHQICGFVHNHLKLEYILLKNDQLTFTHCENSHYEYLGDSFGGEKLPSRDLHILIVEFYLQMQDLESKKYLEKLFHLLSDKTLKELKENKTLFRCKINRHPSYEEFYDQLI